MGGKSTTAAMQWEEKRGSEINRIKENKSLFHVMIVKADKATNINVKEES